MGSTLSRVRPKKQSSNSGTKAFIFLKGCKVGFCLLKINKVVAFCDAVVSAASSLVRVFSRKTTLGQFNGFLGKELFNHYE